MIDIKLQELKTKIVDWMNADKDKCYGCGKTLYGLSDVFDHKRNCIDAPLGYVVNGEKDIFAASSKAWFFIELHKKR